MATAARVEVLSPPEERLGVWEWAQRNLFAGWLNSALTVVVLVGIVALLRVLVPWFLHARWGGGN